MRDDVNERAWAKAKQIVARDGGPDGVAALMTLERVKTLILSGDPEGKLS